MRPNYFIIPLIVIGVSTLGSWFTGQGVDTWYQTLNLPGWTPPGSFIGLVWTILYVLIAISALVLWNRARRGRRFWLIIGVFLLNAFLNAFWSYLFFTRNSLFLAFLDIIALCFMGCFRRLSQLYYLAAQFFNLKFYGQKGSPTIERLAVGDLGQVGSANEGSGPDLWVGQDLG